MTFRLNIMQFITYPICIYLCYIGKLDWVVLWTIFLLSLSATVTFRR